jgi:hypothetical protein
MYDYPVPMTVEADATAALPKRTIKTDDFNIETIDEIVPGLTDMVQLAAIARRDLLANRDKKWANSKEYGWTLAYKPSIRAGEAEPYLEPVKKSDVKDGEPFWASTKEYMNAVCEWVKQNYPTIDPSVVDAGVHGLGTQAMLYSLDNLEPMEGENPEDIARANEYRKRAREGLMDPKYKDLARFDLENKYTSTAQDILWGPVHAVTSDPELNMKTGTGELVGRGIGSAALLGANVAAPELMAGKLGGSAVARYMIANGLVAPVMNEAMERGIDKVAELATGYGTDTRPFDPMDLAADMALGSALGFGIGKYAPRTTSYLDFRKKGKNIRGEIKDKATQMGMSPKSSVEDLIEAETKFANEIPTKTAGELISDEDLLDYTKGLMFRRGKQDRLKSRAAELGMPDADRSMIPDKLVKEAATTVDPNTFVSKPFKEYDIEFSASSPKGESAWSIKRLPDPNKFKTLEDWIDATGIDLADMPVEYHDELLRAARKYKAGDYASRDFFGDGNLILNEADRRKYLQAFKGKTLGSDIRGMAHDDQTRNMALAHLLENGKLGVKQYGVFMPADEAQIAARKAASDEYSFRKMLHHPSREELNTAAQKLSSERKTRLEQLRNEKEKFDKAKTARLPKDIIKGTLYTGAALGRGVPMSQVLPGVEVVPNKTLGGQLSTYTPAMVEAWMQGQMLPQSVSDPLWKPFMEFDRDNPRAAQQARLTAIETRGE